MYIPASLANAIQFAVDNGANILSNSWGYPTSDQYVHPVIISAINYALENNCVVIFAAGNNANHATNNNGYVTFPANVNITGVITVGASDRNDDQANYSPTSNLIDIVAPSHRAYPSQITGETFEMWSIDIPGNYGYNPWPAEGKHPPTTGETLPNAGVDYLAFSARFGGTSHSCPVVAGVAALMLSINPNLNYMDVFNILMGTADKVGVYAYSNGRCNQMGYGRVNAYNALVKVLIDQMDLYISGPSILCSSGDSFSISNLPQGATVTWNSYSGIYRTSVQGSNPCTFIATSSGTTGWLGASITYNGYTIPLTNKSIWLGGVPSPTLYANNVTLSGSDWYTVSLNTSDVFFYLVPDPDGSPIYPDTWEVWGDSDWYTNDSYLEFYPRALGENYVAGYRHNVCGSNGTYFTIEVVMSKSGDGEENISFKLDPNPAREYVDISLNLSETNKLVDSYQIDFVNSYSKVVKQVKLSGTSNRVNLQELAPGYYVVMLRYEDEIYSNKLIVE